MKTKSCTIFFFFFLITISLINASPNWESWGNTGVEYNGGGGAFSNLLFGSNYPQGNSNFTTRLIAQSNYCSPLIADFNADGKNEVLLSTTSHFYLYDNIGTPLSGYNLGTNILWNCPAVVNKNQDSTLEFVGVTFDLLGWNFMTFKINNGSIVLDNNNLLITLKTSGQLPVLVSRFSAPAEVGLVFTDNVIEFYNVDDDSFLETTSPPNTLLPQRMSGYYLNGGASYGDVNGDGHTIFAWIVKNSGVTQSQLMTYDTVAAVYQNVTLGITTNGNYSVSIANIGAPGGSLEYIISQSVAGSTASILRVYDNSLTQVMTFSNNDAANPQPAIADIDHDGNNELCICGTNNMLRCWNYAYEINITAGILTSNCTGLFAIGEYDNSNLYSELITRGGMFELIDHNTTNKTVDFGTTTKTGMMLPVAIRDYSNFTKDIFFASPTEIIYITASGTVSVCGNGICEASENVYSCFSDCSLGNTVVLPNETIGGLSYGSQCLNDSWCSSGMCDEGIGLCDGFSDGSVCSNNAQCKSGTCNTNGICGRTDFVQLIDNFFNQMGMISIASRLLLAFLIIAFCAFSGFGIAGIAGTLLGGFIGVLIGSLVFGWLGVWFIIAFFIIGIVSIFIYLFVNYTGGQGG